MPFGDGTGPAGKGNRTGRAAGFCEGFNRPGRMNRPGNSFRSQAPGRGFGRGRGPGRWFGFFQDSNPPAEKKEP